MESNSSTESGQELCCKHSDECPDVLCVDSIMSELNTEWFGNRIVIMDETDSTNEEIKRSGADAPNGLLVIAESQTDGKGRIGRQWLSQKGCGIWMSFLIRTDLKPCEIAPVTLVAALACNDVICKNTQIESYVKWPNDIVTDGKKLAGILTELVPVSNAKGEYEVDYVIVGVGINVNINEFPDELSDRATSLLLQGYSGINRNRLIAEFGKSFEKYYSVFEKDRNMSGLKQEYENVLINRNREVLITAYDEPRKCLAMGINDSGELLVRYENGEIDAIRVGEVSVRGVYGYCLKEGPASGRMP